MSPARRHTHSSRAKELRTSSYHSSDGSKSLVYHGSKHSASRRHSPLVTSSQSTKTSKTGFFAKVAAFFSWTIGICVVFCLAVLVLSWLYLNNQPKMTTKTYLFLNTASKAQVDQPTALLMRVQPDRTQVNVAVFKPTMVLDLPGDYGLYPLDSVVPLLQLDQRTTEYTRSAFSLGLGVVIDHIQFMPELPVLKENGDVSLADLREIMSKSVQQKSSTPFSEKLQLMLFTWQLDQHDVQTQQAESLQTWWNVVSKWPTPSDKDNCSIAIVNTTKTSGVATALTKVLERSELPIIKAGDTTPSKETTQVVLAKQGCEQTVNHLKATIPTFAEPIINPAITTQYRSDVVLLLGSDVAQFVK